MEVYNNSDELEFQGYECDVCGERILLEDGNNEVEEVCHLEFIGGQDSIFGEGNHVSLTLCQHCLKETLGKTLTVSEYKTIKTLECDCCK